MIHMIKQISHIHNSSHNSRFSRAKTIFVIFNFFLLPLSTPAFLFMWTKVLHNFCSACDPSATVSFFSELLSSSLGLLWPMPSQWMGPWTAVSQCLQSDVAIASGDLQPPSGCTACLIFAFFSQSSSSLPSLIHFRNHCTQRTWSCEFWLECQFNC